MNAGILAVVANTRRNARGDDTHLMDHLRDAVESNRVTEAPTTSLHEHHPVHIKEVGR